MESKNITVRLPEELRAALATKMMTTGLTQTQVMLQALRQYLGLPGDPSEVTSLLQSIMARLQAIESATEARIDAIDHTLDHITTELVEYEARIAQLEGISRQDNANQSQANEPDEDEFDPRALSSGPAEW